MRIDKKLNLVIPVDTDDGTVFVHSTPMSREMFEEYFLIISSTFAEIYKRKLDIVAGPRVAMMMLKKVAQEMGMSEGPGGAEDLVAEIRRLTNVAIPSETKGWETYPLQDVIDRKLLTPDDISEVEGAVCFFILASAMHLRREIPAILDGMTSLWDAQTTSLGFTEYVASLRTSIVPKTTETTPSSPPSSPTLPT